MKMLRLFLTMQATICTGVPWRTSCLSPPSPCPSQAAGKERNNVITAVHKTESRASNKTEIEPLMKS